MAHHMLGGLGRVPLRAVLVLFLCGPGAATVVHAAATNSTWIGGDGAPADWNNPANWDNGVPVETSPWTTWQATITNTVDFSSTLNVPSKLNRITTGDGRVIFPAGMSFPAGSGYSPGGGITVGTGGAEFSGSLGFPNGNSFIVANGYLKANGVSWGNTASVSQGPGGIFDMPSFLLSISGNPFVVGPWAFTNTTLIYATGFGGANYRFTGTPTFLDGGRPDWQFGAGFEDGRNYYDLNGFTLTGDQLRIQGAGAPNTRWSRMVDNDGGTVDVNSIIVGNSGYLRCVVQLQDTTVILRGSGVVYDNRSTNVFAYFANSNTTFRFDPSAGSCSLDAGSDDRNSTDLDPADWADNFSFDLLQLGAGDTLTLVGDENMGSGSTNAVYARFIEGVGGSATVLLNGHNMYLLEAPTNVTFDTSLGGNVYFPVPKGTVVLLK